FGGDVPVEADHLLRAVWRDIDGADLVDHSSAAVAEDEPILRVIALAGTDRDVEILLGAREVLGVDPVAPVAIIAPAIVLGIVVELVHAVVPDEPVVLEVHLPDADFRRVEGELEAARKLLELALAV